jgi:ribose/xylose/arabinose/galactoside ABC-type transport system permease subunit
MKPRLFTPERLPLIATAVVCLALYVFGCLRYPNFFSLPVTFALLQDKAALGVVAVGMTFVILSAGIDLSVGAVLGFATIFFATLVMNYHVHPLWAMLLVMTITTAVGALMGGIIHYFMIPPFLITLAGLFFYRGVALLISTRPIDINTPFIFNHQTLEGAKLIVRQGAWKVPEVAVRPEAWIMFAAFALAIFVSLFTSFGRSIYAIGGNEQSALLMGLPVARNKVITYAFSGFCAGLGGLMSMMVRTTGDATRGEGMELDAIAVVVVGGTLLTGGSGSIFGTFLGLLIVGIIENLVISEGFESPAWPRISVGVLLLAFILLQKLLQIRRRA